MHPEHGQIIDFRNAFLIVKHDTKIELSVCVALIASKLEGIVVPWSSLLIIPQHLSNFPK
jgi:hypothetical protein